ncbi:fungal-specific transcription factor domain-containing protein [Aspergillus venezuelensis]
MEPTLKRKRLSYACNYCRQKKTRCDEQQPSCRNCRIAGVDCITTDKRRAGVIVNHRRKSVTETAITPTESQTQSIVRTPVSQSQPSPLPSASQSRVRLSAQCWDRSGWRSGRLPMMPRFVGSCMFDIMTEWLDLAFYRLRIPVPYAASSPTVPASVSLPQPPPLLPSSPEMRVLGRAFLQTLCQIFPFISEEQVNHLCDRSPTMSSSQQALVYLIAAIGSMTEHNEQHGMVNAYIGHCNTLFGHVVAERSLISVQAILLFAIVLRSRDHITWAWDILSLGVSMAQSIGVHQAKPTSQDYINRRQLWWCMYVFEKVLAFETGRASMIWDRELSSLVSPADEASSEEKFQWACISLAETLHEMQERAAGAWRREEWLPQTVEEAIEEKINTAGELAVLLESWWKTLPHNFQPGSSPISDHATSQRSAFLSFYYHYAFMLLKRSVLLVEPSEMGIMIERYAVGKPWQHRIANGAAVCVDAARDMVKLTVATVDSGGLSFPNTLTSPLPAVYVLAIHILRERHSLLIRSDLELMKAAMGVVTNYYQHLESAHRVNDVLSAIGVYAAQCLEGQVPEPFGAGSEARNEGSDNAVSCLEPDSLPFGWGPSALDWAGWDWNDLSHLFGSE